VNRITAIEQQQKDPRRVSIHVDGEFRLGCSVRRVEEFGLQVGGTLDEQTIAGIQVAEELHEAKATALRLLGHRARTVRDLQTRLQKKQYAKHTIARVTEWLTDLGYLDDHKYAAERLEALLRTKKMGRHGLMARLIADGCDPGLARQAVDDALGPADEARLAIELARERAARMRGKDHRAIKRSVAGLLQRRGFDGEHIYAALEAIEPADDAW